LDSPAPLPLSRLLVLLRQTDSRVLAQEQFAEVFASGDRVLTTPFCAPVPADVSKYWEDGLLNDRSAFEGKDNYSLEMPTLDDLLDREGVNWMQRSSFYWGSLSQDFVSDEYPGSESYRRFLSEVEGASEPEFEVEALRARVPFHPENIYAPTFHLWRWERPGPNLQFYRLAD